jgi:hypothetical protein
MIESDVRDILTSLLTDTGSLSAAIVCDDGHTGVPSKRLPLGGDRTLQLELSTRSPKGDAVSDRGATRPARSDAGLAVDAQLEIAVRQLRAVARRWNVAQLPLMRVPPATATADRVITRIESFLRALMNSAGAHNAMMVRRGQLVAAAVAVDELWASRVTFVARRTLAAGTPQSSHGEVIDPDAYAMSFYFSAVLIVAIDAPYAVDFVRHRCRLVARELSLLLPMLEPDPGAPAMQRPIS